MTSLPQAGSAPPSLSRSDPSRAARARAQEWRSLRVTAFASFFGTWVIALWFWGIVAIIAVVITVLQFRGLDDFDGTVFAGMHATSKVFLFVMGIILPLTLIAIHVAGGGTRRSFARALVLGFAAIGVTFALTQAALLLIEHWIFTANGWPVNPPQGRRYASTDQFLTIWLTEIGPHIAFALSGVAVGLSYYRWHGIRGTVLLPLTLSPLVIAEAFSGNSDATPLTTGLFGWESTPVLATVLSVLASVALAAALIQWIAGDTPIKPPGWSS